MEQIGRYERYEEIGRGGMGTVYRARDTLLQREVALKLLPAYLTQDASFSQRFQREAQVIARLEHTHIVPIYDVGMHEERPYLVMRLLNGGTLRQRLEAGDLAPADLVRILEQVASALDTAHNRGIVHRDIKPSNILLDENGAAFVADFGVAKVLDANTQLTGSGVLGTPVYMSPEHFSGKELDGRSDQYSLGVILYEAVTGELPFKGNTIHQLIYQHLETIPRSVHEVNFALPPALSPVLSRALMKEVNGRFPTTEAFAQAVAHAFMSSASEMPHATKEEPAAKRVFSAPLPSAKRPEDESKSTAAQKLHKLYGEGLQAFAAKDWATAVTAFTHVLEIEPDHPKAHSRRQEALKNLQAAPRAVRATPSKSAKKPKSSPSRSHVVAGAGGQEESKRRYPVWMRFGLAGILLVGGLLVWLYFFNAGSAQTVVIVTRDVTATRPLATEVPNTETPAPNETRSIATTIQILTNPGQYTLGDGTELYLATDSIVFVEESFMEAIYLELEKGALVISAAKMPVIVSNAFGARAEVSDGLLGVSYDPEVYQFAAACLHGETCQLVGDLSGEVTLTTGQSSEVGGNGQPSEPAAADYAVYYAFASAVVPAPTATATPTKTLTPTKTPTNTPTRWPTSTATPTQISSNPGDGGGRENNPPPPPPPVSTPTTVPTVVAPYPGPTNTPSPPLTPESTNTPTPPVDG